MRYLIFIGILGLVPCWRVPWENTKKPSRPSFVGQTAIKAGHWRVYLEGKEAIFSGSGNRIAGRKYTGRRTTVGFSDNVKVSNRLDVTREASPYGGAADRKILGKSRFAETYCEGVGAGNNADDEERPLLTKCQKKLRS